MVFKDRYQAGRVLAQRLKNYQNENLFIFGLARGGVPVAYEVAKILHAPLEVIISRKIGAPFNSEYAVGAVSEGDVVIWNYPVIESLDLNQEDLLEEQEMKEEEISNRVQKYRNGRQLPNLSNYTVIVIDDGLATGLSAQAAIESISQLDPQKIIFAAPVCSKDTVGEISGLVSDVVCLVKPEELRSVGAWYNDFNQVSDSEVVGLLNSSRHFSPAYKRPPAHI